MCGSPKLSKKKKEGKVAHVDRTREPGELAAADSDALRSSIKQGARVWNDQS